MYACTHVENDVEHPRERAAFRKMGKQYLRDLKHMVHTCTHTHTHTHTHTQAPAHTPLRQ